MAETSPTETTTSAEFPYILHSQEFAGPLGLLTGRVLNNQAKTAAIMAGRQIRTDWLNVLTGVTFMD